MTAVYYCLAFEDVKVTDSVSPSTKTVLGGRYELLEQAGEGGMAVVWRAFDTVLKREVALKILHEYVPPSDRQRFRRDQRRFAAGRLERRVGAFPARGLRSRAGTALHSR